MFARAITPAALAVSVILASGCSSTAPAPVNPAPAPAPAQAPAAAPASHTFQYAPGTSHYRMTVDAKVTQTVMGQTNDAQVNSGQRFTMALTRQSPDTLSMTLTLDSLTQVTPMGATPGLDSLLGKQVQALVSPSGEFYAKGTATDTSMLFASMTDQLVHVLPRVRGPMTPGATWTDTTDASTIQSGLNVKRVVISTYTVVGDTTINGSAAWKLTRASTATTSGLGNIQGQNASMDGTSTGNGLIFLSHDGNYLGGEAQEEAKAKLTLTDAGVTADIVSSAKTKVERTN